MSRHLEIIGEWNFNGVVLVKLEDQLDEYIPINSHVLPAPYQNVKIRGDVLLVLRDIEGVPLDFTLQFYKEFREFSNEELGLEYDHVLEDERYRGPEYDSVQLDDDDEGACDSFTVIRYFIYVITVSA